MYRLVNPTKTITILEEDLEKNLRLLSMIDVNNSRYNNNNIFINS